MTPVWDFLSPRHNQNVSPSALTTFRVFLKEVGSPADPQEMVAVTLSPTAAGTLSKTTENQFFTGSSFLQPGIV